MHSIKENLNYVMDLFKLFDTIYVPTLLEACEKFGRPEINNRLLWYLADLKWIEYDKRTRFCTAIEKGRFNLIEAASFFAITKYLGEGEDHIEKARYPFDYVFEHEGKIYQLINYSEDGVFKMNFRANMSEKRLAGTVPLILTINEERPDLMNYEGSDKYFRAPESDYVIARVSFCDKDVNDPFEVKFWEVKGEDKNE